MLLQKTMDNAATADHKQLNIRQHKRVKFDRVAFVLNTGEAGCTAKASHTLLSIPLLTNGGTERPPECQSKSKNAVQLVPCIIAFEKTQ